MATNANKVMTAPLAIIKVNGVAIGKMKNIRVSESIQRGKVTGLGQLTKDELPALSWEGTISCGFFCIDLKTSMIPGAINRAVQNVQEWADTVLLQEDGVQIDIMKKVKDPAGKKDSDFPGGVIKSKLVVFASIKQAFLNRENFDISEGQVSGRDVEMEYLEPILFPL
jgi:hypothetical protein